MLWDTAGALPIGSPRRSVDGNAGAGQVSLIASFDDGGLHMPSDAAATLVEDATDGRCGDGHAWAYFLGPGREFGSAFSFYSVEVGGESADYRNGLITSAPVAGNTESGRVMQYVGCGSCVMFSRTLDAFERSGNEFGTGFGSSVAVGFFEAASHDARDPWWAAAREHLAVGAPLWNGNGAVHVYDREAYRDWESAFAIDGAGGNRQCDFGSEDNPQSHWRLRTLAGGFATGEFGRTMAAADFNCDGYDDLAVGAPGADIPGGDIALIADAGAVHVYYGGPLGLGNEGQLTITQGDFGGGGEPEAGDRFGTALAVGNFDGTRTNDFARWSCWDLAVGTPDEDEASGEVQVFLGDPGGLTLAGITMRLGEGGLVGAREPGDRFGHALVANDFESQGDGFHDLAIGAPGASVGGIVVAVPGTATGVDLSSSSWFGQGSGEIGGESEPGDQLGWALGASIEAGPGGGQFALGIGVPGEDEDTGEVLLISLSKNEGVFGVLHSLALHLDDIDGTPAPGDRFGSVLGQPRAFPHSPFLSGEQ